MYKLKNKNTFKLRSAVTFITLAQAYLFSFANSVKAADLWNVNSPSDFGAGAIGNTVDALLTKAFDIAQTLLIAAAIILTAHTVYKTVVSQGNAKEMEAMPEKWKSIVIMLVMAGGAGAIINIALKFLGFGDFSTIWTSTYQPLLNMLNSNFWAD